MAGSTDFSLIYDNFLHTVTDDMYISWSEGETYEDLQGFLTSAIVNFRFPKKNLYDYDLDFQQFNVELTFEEIDIITTLMIIEWIKRQITTVRLTELQYTGSDAKVLNTKSQLIGLLTLKEDYEKQLEKKLFYYQNHSQLENGDIIATDLKLSGKGSNNNDLLRKIRRAHKI